MLSPGLTYAFLPSLNLASVHEQVEEIMWSSSTPLPSFFTTQECLPVACWGIVPKSKTGAPSTHRLGLAPTAPVSAAEPTGNDGRSVETDTGRYWSATVAVDESATTTAARMIQRFMGG